MIYDATGVARYSAHYNMDIVDRVGGGDSFTGAMIYSLITGKNDKASMPTNKNAGLSAHGIMPVIPYKY